MRNRALITGNFGGRGDNGHIVGSDGVGGDI